ncbi:MAG TPA: hypothetical protein EYQ00_08425 [Dehalococcoidia bacterium]|nr:hypothetical protein [Dehalococcoidia bacterium]
MLVRELEPGMLVEPVSGACWALVPWRGHDGKIAGKYLSVSNTLDDSVHHSWVEPAGTDPLLYIGPLDRASDGDIHTPGRQLILHEGQAYSVDPNSWRFLQKTSVQK